MSEETKNFIKRHSMEGSSILVAVSGGTDSTALLHVLTELGPEFDLNLSVAHLNHCIRGESSAEDAEFVRKIADELELKSIIEKRPVTQVAEEKSQSLEEAARDVRYDFLTEVARAAGIELVALGHNKNDQAETILMNLIRGAGLRGLGGMKEKNGRYVRPFLNVPRKDIKNYLESKEIDYRFDETNEDTTFTRNRIRHELIPRLEENYNPNIIDNLFRLGNLAREAREFIEGRAEGAFKEIRLPEKGDGICFNREKLLTLHPYIQRVTIRKFLKEARGNLEDITFSHVEDLLTKLRKEPASTQLDLPGITFSLDRDRACFGVELTDTPKPCFCFEIGPEESVEIEEVEVEISLETKSIETERDPDIFDPDRLIETVDWRKVEQPITVRNRKDGDWFVPLGMKGKKKLKDFFIDLKVPIKERDRIPLVCDRRGIIWIVGFRIDERYKVDESTEEVLTMRAREI